MPGTKLFEDVKAEGRLDHEQWDLYDTRHVVMEPKHMTRDELIDGYVWLFEQCYGTDKMLDRLERTWRRRASLPPASAAAKAFVAARLAPDVARGDRELRDLYLRSFKLMFDRSLNAEPGQLLFLLDAYDFARFMRRQNSPRRDVNYRMFEAPSSAERAPDSSLRVRQWENKKAQLRTEKRATKKRGALPVVPG